MRMGMLNAASSLPLIVRWKVFAGCSRRDESFSRCISGWI